MDISLHERLAVIETKVDELTSLVKNHIEKHDNRIRVLERFRNIAIGAFLVVPLGTSALLKYLTGAS